MSMANESQSSSELKKYGTLLGLVALALLFYGLAAWTYINPPFGEYLVFGPSRPPLGLGFYTIFTFVLGAACSYAAYRLSPLYTPPVEG
jgi:hypothetical protein